MEQVKGKTPLQSAHNRKTLKNQQTGEGGDGGGSDGQGKDWGGGGGGGYCGK